MGIDDSKYVDCVQCGWGGQWLGFVSPRPWFLPNEHDDGIANICNMCWTE